MPVKMKKVFFGIAFIPGYVSIDIQLLQETAQECRGSLTPVKSLWNIINISVFSDEVW